MSETSPKITPMLQQYLDVRKTLPPRTLLFFRMGDFYELFGEDAVNGSSVLGVTLTQRNGLPMAGAPYHACDSYVAKALAAGWKVAICDQMETPRPGQLVKRQLTRILTPATTIEDAQLDARRNRYLLAIDLAPKAIVASWLDLSTGEFAIAGEPSAEAMLPVLHALDPREILLPEDGPVRWQADAARAPHWHALQGFLQDRAISHLPEWRFEAAGGAETVRKALGVHTLDAFGIPQGHPALGAAGAIIHYATETLCAQPGNLHRIRLLDAGNVLTLDPATLRNLEIFRSSAGSRDGSLLEAMDGTVTAPGARLLESWLAAPRLDLHAIRNRQAVTGEFLAVPGCASELREHMRLVRDIPRILGRLQNRLRNPRELGALRDTLLQLPILLTVLGAFEHPALLELANRVQTFPALADLLARGLREELPNALDEGGYIADGFDEELDRLRALTHDNKTWISDLEREEQARTGIRNLKIRYTGAFGYYIEVTKSNLANVPDNYIRRQTTVNAERFTTDALKAKEREILHADEHSIAREEALFRELVEQVLQFAADLRSTSEALAEIDVLLGWARLAREWNWCRPEVDDSDAIEIVGGRHPVIERRMRDEPGGVAGTRTFVPNDTALQASGEQIALITGPNMAGKSTYIRQVALICLMAHAGCWTPATSCRIGLVDRIFSRVGASDELARGNSTFMVEMSETANILHNATARSLVILDEIGRGTSTYDGLSIAWAVVEHLHGPDASGPRTLFATHYHELTQLAARLPRLRNYCVAVKEWNDEIIFVRQVVRGAADRSYGIHVARLAGLPASVIARAKVILEKLESDDSSHNLLRKSLRTAKSRADADVGEDDQLSLF